MINKVLAALVTIALCAVSAQAKDSPRSLVKQARDLIRQESLADGVRVYAAALRLAEKKKDLPAQEHVVRSLMQHAGGTVLRSAERADLQRTALLVLLEGLDPKRNSAFLCRGQVAHALLLDATRTGAFQHVDAAAEATHAHAKLAKSGAHAQLMTAYADALVQVAAGEQAQACAALQKVLDVATAEGWKSLSIHAASELAAAHVKLKQEAKAAAALRKAGTLFQAGGDYAVAATWRTMLEKRLEGASDEVLAPYKEAVKPHKGGGAAKSTGRSSGKPPSGGSRDRSKVGDAWKKLSKRKPFVTAQRSVEGYAVRQAFDKKFAAVQPYGLGVKHHTAGGITLSFWERSVRLHMVDMTGRETQPGEASSPRGLLFFHPLAREETWGVTKAGGVVITTK